MFPTSEEVFLSCLSGVPFKLAKSISGSDRWRFVCWAMKNGVLEDDGQQTWKGTSYLVKISFIIPSSDGKVVLQKAGNRIVFANMKART